MTPLKLLAATALWTVMMPGSMAQAVDVFAKHPYDGKCGAPLKSADDAMLKADFVIEGVLSNIIAIHGAERAVDLIIEKAKVVRERTPSEAAGKTIGIRLGPCFTEGVQALDGEAGRKLDGKRVRVFGNYHVMSPKRRFFYLQLASSPLPIAQDVNTPWSKKGFVQKVHGENVEKPIGDGWHRAVSSEGRFSIDLPGPFRDMTTSTRGEAEFRLMAKDPSGVFYMATFEPSGPNSQLMGLFDNEMEGVRADIASFRGMPAVSTRSITKTVAGPRLTHTMLFRVPGGTYMLGVVMPEEIEAQTLKRRDRFFNSLSIE